MVKECDRVGLTPSSWAGVDAKAPSAASRINVLPDQGPWGPMHNHAKGCLLSHLDALKGFVAGTASHALILEDDVYLSDDLPLWTNSLEWWPDDAHVIKLERWRDDRLYLLLDRESGTYANRTLQKLHSRHSGTGGYMISRTGANLVLNYDRLDLPIDHLLFNVLVSPLARSLTIYQVNPALVVQGNDPVATRADAAKTRSKRPIRLKLLRALAEVRALAAMPLLLTGRASLTRIGWQSRVNLASPKKE